MRSVKILFIIVISLSALSTPFALFLSQEYNYEKDIVSVSRAYGDWFTVLLTDRLLRVNIDGEVKRLRELFENDVCYVSPLGKYYVVFNEVAGRLDLYSIEGDLPVYTSFASDETYIVPDDGSYLIGYTMSDDASTKVHFYDSNGMIAKTMNYENFERVIVNLSNFILFDCGEDGYYIIDRNGYEVANLPPYPMVALMDSGQRFAFTDGNYVYFYEGEYLDYKYRVNVDEPLGMRYSTDGDCLAIWNREKIVNIDAVSYVEEWVHELRDQSLVVTDIAMTNQGESMFCGIVRDFGEGYSEEERYSDPTLFMLDNRGYQRERERIPVYHLLGQYPKLWCNNDGSIVSVIFSRDFYIYKD